MIGGFLDGYRDSIPRFFEHSKAPIKALIGPWNHTFPHEAEPGPFDRMARGSSALVGLLAEGNAKRNHGRAALRSLHAPLVSARSEHRGNSRRVARGKNLAARATRKRRHFFLEPNYSLGDAPRPLRPSAGTSCSMFRPSAAKPASGGAISRQISGRLTRTVWFMIPRRSRKTPRSSVGLKLSCRFQAARRWPIGSCVFPTLRPTAR